MQQGKARSHGKGAMKKGSEGEGVKVKYWRDEG